MDQARPWSIPKVAMTTNTDATHWAARAAAAFPASTGPAYRQPDALRALHANTPTSPSPHTSPGQRAGHQRVRTGPILLGGHRGVQAEGPIGEPAAAAAERERSRGRSGGFSIETPSSSGERCKRCLQYAALRLSRRGAEEACQGEQG